MRPRTVDPQENLIGSLQNGVDPSPALCLLCNHEVRRYAMKARIVRIGNSRGVRLPKPLIAEAGLPDEVEIRARNGAIIISPASRLRAGWAEAAKQARERDEDRLMDAPTTTHFDAEEWEW